MKANDQKKTIYWNTDTQYDFMRDDESHHGRLPVAGARSIEGNLERLTRHAEANNIRVINTMDLHDEHSPEISSNPDYQTTFPMHCERGTKGAENVPATAPNDPYVIDWKDQGFDEAQVFSHRNIVLTKDHFDAYHPIGAPHTETILDLIGPDRVVVYGVATNVCVDYAVMGNLARGRDVIVVIDAIKELPGLPLDAVLQKWKDAGARFMTTGEIITLDEVIA